MKQNDPYSNPKKEVFVFFLHVKPTQGSPHAAKIAGAHADIWILDSTIESARTKALALIMEYSWYLIEETDARVMQAKQIADLRIDAQQNYAEALQRGISVSFAAYSHEEREDNHVEFFPLGNPPSPTNAEH